MFKHKEFIKLPRFSSNEYLYWATVGAQRKLPIAQDGVKQAFGKAYDAVSNKAQTFKRWVRPEIFISPTEEEKTRET